MKSVRIGIVGLGFMAATHLKACRHVPGATVTALCNPSGRHLDGDFSNVAGNIGDKDPIKLDMANVKAYRSFQDLLADPNVDAIDICSPTSSHPELALAALKAGKHVLCEKPLARTSKEAKAMVAEAEKATTFFMPAMCIRFWPEWAWVRQAMVEGHYGRVLSARFRRVAEPPGWGSFLDGAKSGGALLDLHIHDTDFVQHCFGKPVSVLSTGYTKISGAIDHVVTQYQVTNGSIVSAEGAWAMTKGFGFNMSFTVNFERATADYDSARGAEALKLFEEGRDPRIVSCEGGDGYIGEIKHFVDSIRNNRRPTIVTPQDGLRSVEICEAEERSVRTGQIVIL